MRRLVAILLAFAVPMTVAACGMDGSPLVGPASVAGTYTLRTINGSPLPYALFQAGDDKYEITAGAITLAEGGTWSQSSAERMTEGSSVVTSTSTVTGTYSRTGTVITLVSPAAAPVTGSLDSGTLTLTQDGYLAVYTK